MQTIKAECPHCSKEHEVIIQLPIGAGQARILLAYIQRLHRFGTSIEITWGEDDGLWTVAWISGGMRFTANSLSLEEALGAVWLEAAIAKARGGAE